MINELYDQAELSLAAYATLAVGIPNTEFLEEAGMSSTQAARFASEWRVVEQYNHEETTTIPTYDDAHTGSGLAS